MLARKCAGMLQTTAPFRNTGEARIREGPSRHSDIKETDVLKTTFAIGGLAIATAAGAMLTSSPSSAQVPTWHGGGHWSNHHHFRFWSHHRNFNANENELFNRIRIRVHNRNNNIAIARNDQAQAQRENQRQRERQFQEEVEPTPGPTVTTIRPTVTASPTVTVTVTRTRRPGGPPGAPGI